MLRNEGISTAVEEVTRSRLDLQIRNVTQKCALDLRGGLDMIAIFRDSVLDSRMFLVELRTRLYVRTVGVSP